MFLAPQELGDVLHATHGYVSQIHHNERLLHGRFPAPVALYDGCLERGQAKFRDGDITEACLLLVQHRVERVLDCATDERFQVVLESGIVDLPHTPLSGICEGEYALPTRHAAFMVGNRRKSFFSNHEQFSLCGNIQKRVNYD